MHHGKNLVIFLRQLFFYRFHRDGRSPWGLHSVYQRAKARGHFNHTRAEQTVVDNKHVVAVFHQVDKAGFHTGGACA